MSRRLLTAKLHPPRVPTAHLVRSRLIDILETSLDEKRKPILLSAPAGYGKTTLAVDWIRQSEARFAWLTLDKGDNDLGRFVQYVIAAVRETSDQVGTSSLELIKAPIYPNEEEIASAFVDDLSTIESKAVLLLDDYHNIRERSVHSLVFHLLLHAPDSIVIALLGCFAGLFISYRYDIPSGASIIFTLVIMFILARIYRQLIKARMVKKQVR